MEKRLKSFFFFTCDDFYSGNTKSTWFFYEISNTDAIRWGRCLITTAGIEVTGCCFCCGQLCCVSTARPDSTQAFMVFSRQRLWIVLQSRLQESWADTKWWSENTADHWLVKDNFTIIVTCSFTWLHYVVGDKMQTFLCLVADERFSKGKDILHSCHSSCYDDQMKNPAYSEGVQAAVESEIERSAWYQEPVEPSCSMQWKRGFREKHLKC